MRDPWRLEVVDLSLQLAGLTYRATARFPSSERFGLVDQMRRASVSVGSCIAEGCGCGTDPGFGRYLQTALSSLLELEYQTRLATRLGFGAEGELQELEADIGRLKRKLVSLKNAVAERMRSGRRSRPPNPSRPPARVRASASMSEAPDKRSAP